MLSCVSYHCTSNVFRKPDEQSVATKTEEKSRELAPKCLRTRESFSANFGPVIERIIP